MEKDRLDLLYARVTALTVIVETLLTDSLAADDDPKMIGDAIVKSALATEGKIHDQGGDDTTAMQITEAISAIVDRAVKRAIDLRARRPRSSPQ